jgi:hypothetical protein
VHSSVGYMDPICDGRFYRWIAYRFGHILIIDLACAIMLTSYLVVIYIRSYLTDAVVIMRSFLLKPRHSRSNLTIVRCAAYRDSPCSSPTPTSLLPDRQVIRWARILLVLLLVGPMEEHLLQLDRVGSGVVVIVSYFRSRFRKSTRWRCLRNRALPRIDNAVEGRESRRKAS